MQTLSKRLLPKMLISIVVLSLFLGCSQPESKNIKVFVSILPQKYFVERIGGSEVDVSVLVGPGLSPAMYEPLPKQMLALGNTDTYSRIGVPFETSLLDKITENYPELKVVDTRQGIELHDMEIVPSFSDEIEAELEANCESACQQACAGCPNSQPQPVGNDQHGKDPHIWLNPVLVKTQAKTIYEALSQAKPELQSYFKTNLEQFLTELDQLTNDINTTLSQGLNKKMLVFHPSWGYFAQQFGLKQIPIEIEGKQPSPRELSEIIQLAKAEQIQSIFIQSQFSSVSAEAIAKEIGAKVIALDPLAENYIANLKQMATTIAQAN